jgi:hypothetical protein
MRINSRRMVASHRPDVLDLRFSKTAMSEGNALAGQSLSVGNPQATKTWIGNPGDLTNQVFAIPALQCCKAGSFRILSGIEPLHVEDFGTADALEYEVAAFFFALADDDICRVIAKFQATFFRTRCRGRAHQVNPAFFLRVIVFHWHNSCPGNLDAGTATRDQVLFCYPAAYQSGSARSSANVSREIGRG